MIPHELIAQIEKATAQMSITVREQMDKGDFRAAQRIAALQTRITDAIRSYGLELEGDAMAGPQANLSAH